MIQVDITNRIDIYILAFLVCLVMLVDTYQHHIRTPKYPFRFFCGLLVTCMLLLAMEATAWVLDGYGTPKQVLLFNTISFAVHPLPAFFWGLYVNWHIERNKEKVKQRIPGLLIPIAAAECLLLANLFLPLVFSVDINGYYHRESFFYLFLFFCFYYLGYTLYRLCRYRARLEPAALGPMLFFHLPPLICGFLQTLFYGTSLIWPGMTLSLLIVFVYIQNRRLGTDYLTGCFNRMQLDHHMRQKIQNLDHNSFSAIMLDIDNFKEINDQYGHIIGDEILTITASLLKRALNSDDFLARYGGDEFLIVLDIDDSKALAKIVNRIQNNLDAFNQSGGRPFQLRLSMGYAVYDPNEAMTAEQFAHYIDVKMYENKRNHRPVV